ncbi:hypothetical protein [Amycolatopsis pigmentata]|uniref:Apolipoprotein N-acyltransferase n=1 Tax=Amycolatopsis pigmentata TaxID=450801 RepID=A0ABW5FZY3_9PSEU
MIDEPAWSSRDGPGKTAEEAGEDGAYLPPMNTIFQTAPIGADVWLRILAAAVAAGLVVAADKRLRRTRT